MPDRNTYPIIFHALSTIPGSRIRAGETFELEVDASRVTDPRRRLAWHDVTRYLEAGKLRPVFLREIARRAWQSHELKGTVIGRIRGNRVLLAEVAR